MLRALQIFTACLASFPFLVSPPRSIPRWNGGTYAHAAGNIDPGIMIELTFDATRPAPLNDGKALVGGTSEGWSLEGVPRVLTGKQQRPQLPVGSTFPTVELLAPWNAGFSRQTTSLRWSPYESCPASFPQCQTLTAKNPGCLSPATSRRSLACHCLSFSLRLVRSCAPRAPPCPHCRRPLLSGNSGNGPGRRKQFYSKSCASSSRWGRQPVITPNPLGFFPFDPAEFSTLSLPESEPPALPSCEAIPQLQPSPRRGFPRPVQYVWDFTTLAAYPEPFRVPPRRVRGYAHAAGNTEPEIMIELTFDATRGHHAAGTIDQGIMIELTFDATP